MKDLQFRSQFLYLMVCLVLGLLALQSSAQTFGVRRELWTNLDSDHYVGLSALTNVAANPAWPDNPDPSYGRLYSEFEAESYTGLYDYGQRMRAFIVPPTNGFYSFWIASDDTSELFLSSDENSSNKVSIAVVDDWTDFREWDKLPSQGSVPVLLQGGGRYYIEALMQQASGGDNLSVRWQLPNGSYEEPIPANALSGTKLIPYTGTDSFPGIYLQPSDTTVLEGTTASFFVVVTNQALMHYQWQCNGTNLTDAQATTSVYFVTNASVALHSGATYSCVISNSAGSVTSATATLTVISDTIAPTIVKVSNSGTTNVQLLFSEPLEESSATNTANYVFTNALTVIRASLDTSNGIIVTLTTAPLAYASNYWLVINGISDRATNPNVIASNTLVGFQASPYTVHDINNPVMPSMSIVLTNGLNVTAVGGDIGGSADQFGFNYQMRSGDFDIAVRVAGLSPSDVWAKAGLMARETLDPGSRFAASVATPAMNGSCFEYRLGNNQTVVSVGNFPPNFPDTWLRLKRVGNEFTSFASYDGQVWAPLGNATVVMASQLYIGLAVSSRNASQSTTAQFRDFQDVSATAFTAVIENPHEALGPSSRKTPIVISEIMYKPAPRADSNNVEFIEIYNTNPWFHDIGGYKLVADSLTYTFPQGTILPGGAFLVIAASPAGMQNVYGLTNVFGPYIGSLKKSGTIQLLDEQGAVLLTVPYSNVPPWPVAADGAGHSLVLANPTYGESDPRAWDVSDMVGGSPGLIGAFTPSPLRNVVINEFLAHTDDPDVDYIELYNHSNQGVDISGCVLTDDPATNKFVIPPGTVIPARGFVYYTQAGMSFSLNAAGETIYFKNPDQSRVLDAVHFDAQENGVAMGRWPDGADQFYRLNAKTPGTNNAGVLGGQVVINELMYNPISGDDDDQYVELYNQGTNAVDLAGWTLNDGISFTFPSNSIIAADEYLVVARNALHLRAKYSNLNAINTLGDFTGKLSHGGERIALTMPDTIVSIGSGGKVTTNLVHIAVDEVTYGTGGRWGQWADGGGSSLELIDPRSDHRLPSNWADSDESQKSAWVTIQATGVLDNGNNFDPSIDYAQIGLLDVGECLVDNIEVRAGTNGPNLVSNAGFENGTNGWSFQGCMVRSSLENTGDSSSHSLHIRCSDSIWTGVNSCQVALDPNTLDEGQTATLRFKARWIRGWPEVLMRLHGNWLEATGALPIPANLGTPGARNSRSVTNAGPAIYATTHNPALPDVNQPVVVTARVQDPDGLQNMSLHYRLDPSETYTTLTMKDDGSGGDAVAGDGIFSATIPGQAAGVLAPFYLTATDGLGVTTRFPTVLADNAPTRECLVMFGDANPGGSFGAYHLWVSQTNVMRWSSLSDLSNESHDCSFVSGRRVIYNMQGRFAGSPFHQTFDSPSGNLCHYKWIFNDDDKFLGATSFNKLHQPGNAAGDDGTLQREQLANVFLRTLGVPWLNRRYVVVYVNGNRRGTLMEDTQVPDKDVIEEHFPNDAGGYLYKMQPWFEFASSPVGNSIDFRNNEYVTLMPYTTVGGMKKIERYRYHYLVRRTADSASNFTNVFSLVDAASSYGTPNYATSMQNLADMENWMRVFAVNHAAANRDAFGCGTPQNVYAYIGRQGTRFNLFAWDLNIVFDNGSTGPGQDLFDVYGNDLNTINIYKEPTFRRMYWRALQELVDGPLDPANSGPLLDAKYRAFLDNGLDVSSPETIKSWLSTARSSIVSQIAAENTSSFSVDSTEISNNLAYITGTAPVNVKTIWINGVEYPLIWTSVTGWRVAVPLQAGTNIFNVTGVDIHGQPLSDFTNSLAVVYTNALPSAVGQVVINEIMYNPALPDAAFVELFNTSTNFFFDLSGWQLKGVSYTFPPGSLIGPNEFLVLANNRAAFAAAYGATIPVFDTFPGTLQNNGETLTLVQPGTNSSGDVVVSKVRYDIVAPWPTNANGTGSSLQLIDAQQDNWRAGNWAAVQDDQFMATPGTTNSVAMAFPVFPSLWINELEAENLTGITNGAGQRTGWLELYNPGSNAISLNGLYLANDYSNLTNWAFPEQATINPGQFKTIFADGQTNISTLNELHTSFILSNGTGSVALSRLINGKPQVLDYVNYTNLSANHSYGSFPDGQSFERQDFFFATAGGANNATSPTLTLAINEWMAANTNTIQDPLDGNKYDDWFELYNYGSNSINPAGYYLTMSLTNKFMFQIPSGYTIPAHGFLLVWADKKTPTGNGDLHVNFKLNKAGSSIGLFAPDGNAIDYVTFGTQTGGTSMGRAPDGSANIVFMNTPTPRTTNIAPNTAPSLGAIADRILFPGQTLTFFATAMDEDQPAQSLTFTLGAGAPSGANINSGSGRFSWTPPPAPNTNTISIVVSDNGVPSLSATQTFLVMVIAPPRVTHQLLNGNEFSLSWPTVPGQAYTLEYSDDLSSALWNVLGSSFSGTGNPVSLTDTVPNSGQRFFRLKILPQ